MKLKSVYGHVRASEGHLHDTHGMSAWMDAPGYFCLPRFHGTTFFIWEYFLCMIFATAGRTGVWLYSLDAGKYNGLRRCPHPCLYNSYITKVLSGFVKFSSSHHAFLLRFFENSVAASNPVFMRVSVNATDFHTTFLFFRGMSLKSSIHAGLNGVFI